MDKQELINRLKTKFYAVDETKIHEGATEAGITVWGIGVFEKIDEVVRKLNLTFYTKGEDAFWGVSEPNPTPLTAEPTFADRMNFFIASKITDGTIKFAHVEQVSEPTKKAMCVAIMATKAEKRVLVSEGEGGVFSIELIE